MGAETLYSGRPRTPSRLSNCGEMVAESVLEQLEEELMLEEMVAASQPHSPFPQTGGNGRSLLVGMKLNATCREMLAWTIVELARPGDHILAFHVSSIPLHSVVTSRECEEHFEHLANTLRGFLAIYEDLCLLKQIKLEVEILPGVEVKKTLVDFAKTHKTCKLILGSNKHFTVRRNKSLGRYCLKRLPCTCSVVVLQQGEVILNEKGRLSRTDLTSIGAGLIRTLRRGMLSFGRSMKVMNGGSDEGFDDTPRPSTQASLLAIIEQSHGGHSIGYVDYSVELERCYFSDSSLFHSSLFQECTSSRMASPKFEIQRADMFMLEDQNRMEVNSPATSHSILASPSYVSGDSDTPKSSVDLIPGWPLLHHTIGLDKVAPGLGSPSPDMRKAIASSPLHRLSVEKKKPLSSPLYRFSPEKEKSGSLLRHFSDKVKFAQSPVHQSVSRQEIAVSSRMSYDRHMSVVDWALQLPHRNKDLSASPEKFSEEDYGKILGELARDAFRAGSGGVKKVSSTEMSVEAGLDGSWYRANKKVKFSREELKARECSKLDVKMSLTQRLDALCLDQKCAAFAYEELEAATSKFSSSNVVGRGGGSEVYKGMLADGKLVAVKRLNCGPQAEEELLNDVSVNTSLSHPHVVALLGYCVGSSHLILVYDYLPEGNLEDRLHARTKAPVLPWRVRYKAAIGIAKALDYLHHGTSRPVIHRDVKASNILLTDNFESQLSDFGLAKWAPAKASHILCDDILGTFGYLAPEYFMYGRVNNKTDVYAFGVVLLELISGRIPIDNSRPKGHENLVNWARPLLKENNLDELVDPRLEGVYDSEQMNRLLHAASLCLRQSSQRRPRMTRVLQVLCSNHARLQTIHTKPEEREDSVSIDLDECDINNAETPTFACSSDVQKHLALAMLGVDDNKSISQLSSSHLGGVELLHSSRYPQAYLESRFSPSSKLVT